MRGPTGSTGITGDTGDSGASGVLVNVQITKRRRVARQTAARCPGISNVTRKLSRILSSQSDTSSHCETTDAGLVHRIRWYPLRDPRRDGQAGLT